ncbi:Vacuolar protein sorting-associated protein 41 [Knufia peltigerae]|uniref:Vacuolar protein sorting-associated protein 41 n=1 Tax=Knufia peltigerae TaxID=1002370 RepID=A0AA38Y1K6_9EURO|nr:Vacuolar protein sorting-associated protein 41 [Knufia peltigerae]
MAAGDGSSEPGNEEKPQNETETPGKPTKAESTADESQDDEEDEEEEEPQLKYATLTKTIVGTHNGNIHVFSLPSFSPLRVYHAHTASVSAISISPPIPPISILRPDPPPKPTADHPLSRSRSPTGSPAGKGKQQQQLPPVPNTPSNQIYIATSSIDGNVCIASLVDARDVQLRNFGRPVQSVALSPEYKSDRSYLSGGQAGSLVLTTGGQAGKSANATTTGTAAAASGWLGSLGLGANTGTDKVLHSGEGIISTVKWSLSGKYVLWVNEHGIKIKRSQLKLDTSESGTEWKTMSHIDRPARPGWEDMAGVWKARAEWIDRDNLEIVDESPTNAANGTPSKSGLNKVKVEEVLVGWGDSAWIIKVYPGTAEGSGHKTGRAEVATMQKGPSLASQGNGEGKKGRRTRHNALEPELRLVDIHTKEEIDTDTLTVSRYETLSASDYHLGVLPPVRVPSFMVQKGYLGALGSGMSTVGSSLYTGVETVGQGVWDATMFGPRMLGANRIFSGADSIKSGTTGPERGSTRDRKYLAGWIPGLGSADATTEEETPLTTAQSMKIFILSPYDCIVAVKRNLNDRMQWLISVKRYQQAWELVDDHPEAAGSSLESPETESPPTPSKASSTARSATGTLSSPDKSRQHATLAEFFNDSNSMTSSAQAKSKGKFSAAEKEKRRIGELWLKQLTDANNWQEAGEVAAKVLNTTTRWEHWIWRFIKRQKFDEISPYVPTLELTPPLPSSIYEIILGFYVETDKARFKELLDQWPSDLFEISSITTAIEDQLRSGGALKASDDWRLLQEGLAKLFLADGRYNDALKCYIHLQDADTALSLIKEHHLVEAIADDIPSFVTLRVTPDQLKSASTGELDEFSVDSIQLLVDEATAGVVEADEVVSQLSTSKLRPFLYFYFRALWRGEGSNSVAKGPRVGHSAVATALIADTGKQLVEQFADTAVELFSEYDRSLLMDFLQTSTAYTFEKAVKLCEKKHYIEELVFLLSKTGQMKKALFLIIDDLKDAKKAIAFAKEQDDKGLWDDLLEYSMSRPRFISELLAEVGTAIDPITLVKRIPSGLEVEGLKDGLRKMLREYDLQDSISSGVARVLSSEVAVGMETLRRGRRKGIKFEVMPHHHRKPVHDAEHVADDAEKGTIPEEAVQKLEVEPGRCASCHRVFIQDEKETLVGFACGHVYHVSHLLHGPEAEGDEAPLPDSATRRDRDSEGALDDFRFSRSVGPKVTNARLLKDKIQAVGGCRICKT